MDATALLFVSVVVCVPVCACVCACARVSEKKGVIGFWDQRLGHIRAERERRFMLQ